MPDNSLLHEGVIKVTGDTIEYAGARSAVSRSSTDRVVNLGKRVVIPGLINMHTHLEEGCLKGKIDPSNRSFTAWMNRRDKMMKEAQPEDILNAVQLGIRESIANGITSIVDTSSRNISPIVFRDEPIRSWVIHEVETGDGDSEEATLKSLEKRIRQSRRKVDHGIAPYSIFSLPISLQKKIITITNKNNSLWACHIAESGDEQQAFTEHSGELFHRITRNREWSFGDDMRGSLNFAITRNLIPNRGILYHLNYSSSDELGLLSAKNITLVICPEYNELMGHRRLPLGVAQNRNLNICIGTESPLGLNAINLFDELYAVKRAYPHLSTTELLSWVTKNPAKALGAFDTIGSIEAGKKADIIGLKIDSTTSDEILEEILMEEANVNLVIINGEELIIE